MGTRSRIGIQYTDGSIESIYCHFDGYPSHNGRILTEHYTDDRKIDQLMDLGDVSVLKEEIGEKHPFNRPAYGTKEYEEYEAKYSRMCLAYGRDRGEKNTQSKLVDSFDEFMGLGEEYMYLFRDGQWECYDYRGKRIELNKNLEEA